MSISPYNIDDLVNKQFVESSQIEYKGTWSEPIRTQVIKTITAFANDFHNLGGGYIIIGIDEKAGEPLLPPRGLNEFNLDEIQKEIRGQCKRIDPEYQPACFIEEIGGKQVLVIWAPAGEYRPYQAPISKESKERAYFIRLGSETTQAQGINLTQLMQMTARVPFDDRKNLSVDIGELSSTLVRRYLTSVKSKLLEEISALSDEQLYSSLNLTSNVHGRNFPKNVALLFFCNSPDKFFPGARIEVVQFHDDAGGNLLMENTFIGPLNEQIRASLDFLNNLSSSMVRKVPGKAEALRSVAYPYEALEEALVNSVFHKSYEIDEPVKVYLYPDRLEIISYPGPMPGIKIEDLLEGKRIPPVQNRNRRIGDFLKDFRLAEARGTGIPKIRRRMSENGSPSPEFRFDEERSYFQVTLPAHPQYIVINTLRESAHLWATGERSLAIKHLEEARKSVPSSGALIAQLIDYQVAFNELIDAEHLFNSIKDAQIDDKYLAYLAIIKCYLDYGQYKKASALLEEIPNPSEVHDILDLALLNKRAKRYREAHSIFQSNYEFIQDEPKAIHEFAQTKMRLASAKSADRFTRKRLNTEATELLRRCIQLTEDDTRKAWCWFDLARNLIWIRSSDDEIENAFSKALDLLPTESRFLERYKEWKKSKLT